MQGVFRLVAVKCHKHAPISLKYIFCLQCHLTELSCSNNSLNEIQHVLSKTILIGKLRLIFNQNLSNATVGFHELGSKSQYKWDYNLIKFNYILRLDLIAKAYYMGWTS